MYSHQRHIQSVLQTQSSDLRFLNIPLVKKKTLFDTKSFQNSFAVNTKDMQI